MVSHPIKNLLKGLIDYAGLFPPARLEMALAVAEYDRQRQSGLAWMLDRFVVPAGRLGELDQELGVDVFSPAEPWPLSVLVGPDLAADAARVDDLEVRREGALAIPSVEAKPATPAEVAAIVRAFPGREVYCELPLSEDPRPWLHAIVDAGARAKIRTGGIEAAAFPAIGDLARFLFAAAAQRVAFKATAGLHHPLRGEFRLTYEPGSACATMHGFLNLFLAAAFVFHGELDDTGAKELLAETRTTALEFTNAGIAYAGVRLSAEAIAEARRSFALSYGSCSFDEPVADLRRLHLL
jgi:hypothetical protein